MITKYFTVLYSPEEQPDPDEGVGSGDWENVDTDMPQVKRRRRRSTSQWSVSQPILHLLVTSSFPPIHYCMYHGKTICTALVSDI